MRLRSALKKVLAVIAMPHVICWHFSTKKKIIIEDIRANIKETDRPDWLNLALLLIYNRGYRNIFYKRIGNLSHLLRIILPQEKTFGCYTTTLGGGIVPSHPFATVLNAASIGVNFSFRNSLTIGKKHPGDSEKPIIGDNVFVGANVVIIGGIRVGNNVVIGAGSVVVDDVPDNVVIAGNPARIVRKR